MEGWQRGRLHRFAKPANGKPFRGSIPPPSANAPWTLHCRVGGWVLGSPERSSTSRTASIAVVTDNQEAVFFCLAVGKDRHTPKKPPALRAMRRRQPCGRRHMSAFMGRAYSSPPLSDLKPVRLRLSAPFPNPSHMRCALVVFRIKATGWAGVKHTA